MRLTTLFALSALTIGLALPPKLTAQHAPHACGQVSTPEQVAYLSAHRPELLAERLAGTDTLRVPVLFHRIGDGQGMGAVNDQQVDQALARLNAAYAPGRIVFAKAAPTRLVDDTAFYDFAYAEEAALRQAHELPGVINVFVPHRVAGSGGGQVCGYAYLPPTRRDICVVKASCFTNGSTLEHEIGHYLGLYHTHGKSNCGALTDELADGSNCDTAGDDVCDTPADPNLLGRDCDGYEVSGACVYIGTRTDANGDAYAPDVANVMSYSRKACRQHFSPGQLDRARYFLGTSRDYLAFPACPAEAPELDLVEAAYTTLTVGVDLEGGPAPQAYEFEYAVNGGRARTRTVDGEDAGEVYLFGLAPCDSVAVRARALCLDGPRAWGAPLRLAMPGCGLRYCVPTHEAEIVAIADLAIAGYEPDDDDDDAEALQGYALYADTVAIDLAADPASFGVSFEVELDGRYATRPAYVQAWLDLDDDGALAHGERVYYGTARHGDMVAFAVPIASSAPRGRPLRLRVAATFEYAAGPCEGEAGQTHDVDVALPAPQAAPSLRWASDTLWLAHRDTVATVGFAANRDWTIDVEDLQGGAPQTGMATVDRDAGPADTTAAHLVVTRNVGCAPRYARVRLAAADSVAVLIVAQRPARPGHGEGVLSAPTLALDAEGGAYVFEAYTRRVARVDAPAWLSAFGRDTVLDAVRVSATIGANLGADRSGRIELFACDSLLGSVAVVQPGATTRWAPGSPMAVSPASPADTIIVGVASTVAWSVAADQPWIELLDTAGRLDGHVRFRVRPGAPAGALARVELRAAVGPTQGRDYLTVEAPAASGATDLAATGLRAANPFGDVLAVEAPTPRGGGYEFRLLTAAGQVVAAASGTGWRLATGHLPPGLYVLRVTDARGRQYARPLVRR